MVSCNDVVLLPQNDIQNLWTTVYPGNDTVYLSLAYATYVLKPLTIITCHIIRRDPNFSLTYFAPTISIKAKCSQIDQSYAQLALMTLGQKTSSCWFINCEPHCMLCAVSESGKQSSLLRFQVDIDYSQIYGTSSHHTINKAIIYYEAKNCCEWWKI